MISKNSNYFAPELIEGGHYIITGMLNDNYISDTYQQVDINQLLHNELMENDFDIVLFYDYVNRLYCYDSKSRYLLTHANEDASGENTEDKKNESVYDKMRKQGPLGSGRSRRRNREQIPSSDSYSLRFVSTDVAWSYVVSLLRQTKYRTAIVFSNMVGLASAFPQEALEALSTIKSIKTDRPHAAFYMFRSEDGADFSRYRDSSNDEWRYFFDQIIRPLYETDDPKKNRVITIHTPNAAEISNLLNMMRLREDNKLSVDVMNFKKLTEEISYTCATNQRSLRSLKVSLEEHIRKSGDTMTLENYQEVLGVKHEDTATEEINKLIGLQGIKEWIGEWSSSRKEKGLERPYPKSSSRFYPVGENGIKNGLVLNVVLEGRPGTGKTTVAKQLGRLYYELGLLPRGHLVTCSAATLVSQNVGGTASVVRQQVQSAMGGVLLIDEAYALTKNAHGREAIDQLVNDMTQYTGQFAVVICGYEAPMEAFLRTNQGLASRFATKKILEDYSGDELRQIFEKFMAETDENDAAAVMDENFSAEAENFFENFATNHGNEWGNAREAETLLENMKRRAKARIKKSGESFPEGQIVLSVSDIPSELKKHLEHKPKSPTEVVDAFEKNTIGLKGVKKKLRKLANNIGWEVENNVESKRFIFHGPPGSGKTHTARIFADLLYRLGKIKRNYVYEITAKQLTSPDPRIDYGKSNGEQPSISEIVEAAFAEAEGGLIFIDEVHQLAEDSLGESVLSALVPVLDRPDVYKNTCVVIAGYTANITAMLKKDDGLNRRFPAANRIRFDNCNAKELAELCVHFAKAKGHTVTKGFIDRSRAAFSKYLENPEENFGNAGFIRDTYIPGAIDMKNARLSLQELGDRNAIATYEVAKNVELPTRSRLTEEDLPEPFNTLAGPVGIPVPEEPSTIERVNCLVGKKELRDYLAARIFGKCEESFCDDVRMTENHFAIVGPQGTGRHTAARLIAKVLAELEVIDREEVRVTSKGSFEAQYVGQTVPKTLGEIERAKGGCMVVDYPSSMLPRAASDNTFGTDALATIGGAMNSATDKLSVIFIEDEEGFEALSEQMPELVSNFSRVFRFEDFTPDEMYTIFQQKTSNAYRFDTDVSLLLPDFFLNWVCKRGGLNDKSDIWSNGKEVEKLIVAMKNSWKKNGGFTDRSTGVPYRVITKDVFPEEYKEYLVNASADKETALKELNALTGLQGVKKAINTIYCRNKIFKNRAKPGFYAFVGDPGSGKTTVANLFGGILRSVDTLSQGHVVVVNASDLLYEPEKFKKCVKDAKNCVLFIDEAHNLNCPAGIAVTKELLTTVEKTEIMDNLCIILAGYKNEMQALFDSDPGFESRFGGDNAVIQFDNYNANELLSIMDCFAANADRESDLNVPLPLDVSDPEFRNATYKIFQTACKHSGFGNARYVRKYLKNCTDRLASRLYGVYGETGTPTEEELKTLTYLDIPADLLRMIERKDLPAKISAAELRMNKNAPITSENYAETLERVEESVVLLVATDKNGAESTGTGFFVSENGHILTCNHVLRDAVKVKARVYCPGNVGGDYHYFDCTPLTPGCADTDMALAKINGTNFKPLSIRSATEEIGLDEETLMVGYPLSTKLNGGDLDSLRSSHFDGKISGAQKLPRGNTLADIFCLDSSGMPGNSGSAVISKRDFTVIGVFPGAIADSDDKEKSKHRQNIFFPIKYFFENFVENRVDEE